MAVPSYTRLLCTAIRDLTDATAIRDLTDATALTLYAYAYMSIRTHTYTQFRNSHANK